MKDLFEKFANSRVGSGTRSAYSPVECLMVMILAAKGKSIKEISTKIKRTENSLQYKLSKRGLAEIKSPEEFCKKLEIEYTKESFKKLNDEATKLINDK